MGTKAPIAGIIIGSFIFLLFLLALDSGSGGVSEASRYEGLTDTQTRNVELFAESCDTSVLKAEVLAGEERAKLVQEQCDRAIDKKIEEYRTDNAS